MSIRARRLCAVILALVVAGCTTANSGRPATSASAATVDGPVEIGFAIFGGGGPHLDAILAEIELFTQAHPGITVKATQDSFYSRPVPYEKVQARYFAGGADVVSGFVGGSLAPDAEAGRFLDMTPLWDEIALDDAIPASVAELASARGRRYWLPTLVQWNPVFYNTDDFARAALHPPATWEELLAACEALRQHGVDRPIGQAGTESWTPPAARWFSTIDVNLNGPDFHRALALGQVPWTDPRVTAVFDRWLQLFDGCYGDPALQAYSDPLTQLADGRAAMDNLGEWIFESALLNDDDPIDFFTLEPMQADLPRTEIALVYGLAIPSGSSHPAEAMELIRWLVSAESLERVYRTVPRAIVDSRVTPAGYLDRHRAGLQLLRDTDQLVELWEFAATSPQAEIGLRLFTSFLADPGGIDRYLQEAESNRVAAYGAALGS